MSSQHPIRAVYLVLIFLFLTMLTRCWLEPGGEVHSGSENTSSKLESLERRVDKLASTFTSNRKCNNVPTIAPSGGGAAGAELPPATPPSGRIGTGMENTRHLTCVVEPGTSSHPEGYQFWVPMFISLLTLLLTAAVQMYTFSKIRAETDKFKVETELLRASKTNERKKEILETLNSFFGPLKMLRAQSRALYNLFAVREKRKAKELRETKERELGNTISRESLSPEELNRYFFGTVRYLISGHEFDKRDSAILEQIIAVQDKILDLLTAGLYWVGNASTNELLGRYAAHIRAIKLAKEKQLVSITEAGQLSMPLEVDGAIESIVMKLENTYADLSRGGTKSQSSLTTEESETVRYYDENADSYFTRTAMINLDDTYTKFRKHLPLGAFILDAGCGVGRDTRYFIQLGYRVSAFDASIEMVKLCRQYPYAYCVHQSFHDISDLEKYDGVWACASLLHLNEERFVDALSRLACALKVGGILYFSIKAGNSTAGAAGDRDSRSFYYHDTSRVKDFLLNRYFEEIQIWTNVGAIEGHKSEFYNFLFRKERRSSSPEMRI